MRDDDLLAVAAATVRHVMDRVTEPPLVVPGTIRSSTSSGVCLFRQDGGSEDLPITNRLSVVNGDRVLVQFPPSGGAFVLQLIG